MSDLSESIFKLWTLAESKVYPDEAPGMLVWGWYSSPRGAWHSIDNRMELMGRDLDAALWLIVQLVAWAVRGKDDAVRFDCDGNTPWCEAKPHYWIAEATAIVQGWEAKA